jgi:hypothetical protein
MGVQSQSVACDSRSCFTDSGERLMCASAVARRIGRTPRMVRYLAGTGVIGGLKQGKLWFFREKDVIQYIRVRGGSYVQ